MEEKDIKGLFERRLKIRQKAYYNMQGNLEEESLWGDLDKIDVDQVYKEIYDRLVYLKEHGEMIPHRNINSDYPKDNKIVFVKKVIRKIVEKIFGWYYIPLINQQNIYNQYTCHTIQQMQCILMIQQKRIENLEQSLDLNRIQKEK